MSEHAARKRVPELGDLEAEVLRVLKGRGQASAGQVAEELKSQRAIAYTTVSTTLDRLFKKGLVTRTTVSGRTGPKHVYTVNIDPGLQKQLVDAALGRLVDALGPSVTSTIYDSLNEISPGELQRMKEVVDRRKRTL